MDIGVLMLVVAMILPDTGNRDGVVGRGVEAFLIEQLGQVMDAGVVAELPVAVEQLKAVGALPVLRGVVQAVGRRDKIGSVGQGVFGLDQQIFIISRNDHVGLPPVV